MPIRINLLAEAQAAEELRRKDPVKRTIWVCGFFIALLVTWCLTVQARIMKANSELSKHEAHWKSIEKRHAEIMGNLKESANIELKLAALNRLSTNRFLWGSTLNGLQKTVVDQVLAVRIRAEQVYTLTEGTPAKTSGTKKTPAKPATSTEKIVLTIEAKDSNPGEQNYNKLKEALAKYPYFQAILTNRSDALRLTSLSKPTFDPGDPLRSFVLFTLEMQFPEIHRNE